MQHNFAHVLGSLTKSCVSLTIRRGNSMLKVIILLQNAGATRHPTIDFEIQSHVVSCDNYRRGPRAGGGARPALATGRAAGFVARMRAVCRQKATVYGQEGFSV
jgi:hypothetical protein